MGQRQSGTSVRDDDWAGGSCPPGGDPGGRSRSKGVQELSSPDVQPRRHAIAAQFATDAGDGVIRVYDAQTGKESLTVKGLLGILVGFSPDSCGITVAGTDGVVRLYDVKTAKESLAIKGLLGRFAGSSPDGCRIAMAGTDGMVRVYDARMGQDSH